MLAGDVGRGTNIWLVDTNRQKSRNRSAKVDANRDKRDKRKHCQKNHKVWMVPSAKTTSLQRCICSINYPVLPPILQTIRIYKALVYSTRHFQYYSPLMNIRPRIYSRT